MTKSKQKKVLIIPSIMRGNGTGHIRRAIRLAVDLHRAGAKASILFDAASSRMHDCYTKEDAMEFLPHGRSKKPDLLTSAVADEWDICVFDTRQTRPQQLAGFTGSCLTVGLDEGGVAREYFDYLIDVLPNLEKTEPNINSPGFLQFPEQPAEETRRKQFEKVLISFGGEDSENLTGKLLEMIDDTGMFNMADITVVKGPFFAHRPLPEEVTVLDSPENLGILLKEYDLVFTMFGLTCFEALYSRVPVVLFNPSSYHRNLSIRAGIPEIGVNKPDSVKLDSLFTHKERLYRAVETYSGIKRLNLADYILDLSLQLQKCRGCGRKHHKIIFRSQEHSYYKCLNCGLVNQMYFGNDSFDYGPDYFFDDYKKQYGRTYLEDFETIKSAGLRRCEIIKRFASRGKLLDAGCGYGPFLAAAADSGFEPYGIDISENAVTWVNEELGFSSKAIPVCELEPSDFAIEKFEIITMWYVIEHMKELPAVLNKINSMLPVGGVFAIATPNYSGISRLRSVGRFLNANPLDHYTIWNPESARNLLSRYGFRVKIVRCPIIHPERFFRRGFYKSLPGPIKAATGRLTEILGRFFKLGDTFEVYAEKKNNIGEHE